MSSEIAALLQFWHKAPKRWRWALAAATLIYSALLVGAGLALDKGLWRYYQQKYADALIQLDESHIGGTDAAVAFTGTLSQLASSPNASTSTATSQPTTSSAPSATTSPSDTPQPSPSATLLASALLNGTCDEAIPPCLYLGALSWQELGVFLYGDPDSCRWREIADLNRRPDGHYLLPLPDGIGIFMPSVAPRGTFIPTIRDEQGQFHFIQPCSSTSGKPCVYTVPSGILGAHLEAYRLVASNVYAEGSALNARRIMDANLASDCSTNSVSLKAGLAIVIPK